ncbi:hypothetical protein HMPREF9374_3198 [Desmospora sp. 8437]|nr:hypothetical protein HMPREF9374_3198 [Desmospora sp. 8437]
MILVRKNNENVMNPNPDDLGRHSFTTFLSGWVGCVSDAEKQFFSYLTGIDGLGGE